MMNDVEILDNFKFDFILNNSHISSILIKYVDLKFGNKSETACVYPSKKNDNFVIEINKKFFNSLSDKEKEAVLKHELYHIIFKHHYRYLKMLYKNKNINNHLINIAMDMSINTYIDSLPNSAILPENYGFKKYLSFEEYYYKLLDNKNKNEFDNENNINTLDDHEFSFDKILENHIKDENDADIEKILDEYENILDDIENEFIENIEKLSDEQYNKLGFGEREIINQFKKNNINKSLKLIIRQKIKKFSDNTIIVNKKKETWFKLNRRFEFLKGKKKEKVSKILVAVDTSGSVSNELLEIFLSNVLYISKFYRINLILFNTKVYFYTKKTIKIQNILNNIKTGGTNFQSVFDFALKYNYNNIIFFTDCYDFNNIRVYNKNILVFNFLTKKFHHICCKQNFNFSNLIK